MKIALWIAIGVLLVFGGLSAYLEDKEPHSKR